MGILSTSVTNTAAAIDDVLIDPLFSRVRPKILLVIQLATLSTTNNCDRITNGYYQTVMHDCVGQFGS